MNARAQHILIGIVVGAMVFGPFASATDGTNGTSGPAMLDYDTDQLFDSQHPDHYLVVGDQTLTLTGHGTSTVTAASGTLYAGTNITFGLTSTQTGTATASGTVYCAGNCISRRLSASLRLARKKS